jgi:hypothetical protein
LHFVLVIHLLAQGVTGGIHTEKIATFDSLDSCTAAGHALYGGD